MSRELFEAWCEDPRNCVIIADFAVQGTLARDILGNPAEVMTRNGVKVGLAGDPRGGLWWAALVSCFGGLFRLLQQFVVQPCSGAIHFLRCSTTT